MIILGIETTCDETGVAVVKDGRLILSSIVASSAKMHQKYGGVVPEVAAREQVLVIIPTIDECLKSAGIKSPKSEIDAIAVAYGPGLVGSLLIGVETAKVLALVWEKPLIAVNHLLGHVYANWLAEDSKLQTRNLKFPEFPLVALIVSGGHTDLVLMTGHGKHKWLGGTRDDAAGEAFDKVAKLLGLGYPGGPEIEKMASKWKIVNGKSKIVLPRPMIDSKDFDFSFSGIKTASVNAVNSSRLTVNRKREIAYEFQRAVVEVLVKKTIRASERFGAKSIVIGGGVAANEVLRSQFMDHSLGAGIPLFFPSKELAVDNGAMIAAAAFYQRETANPLKLQADPALHF